MLHRIFSLLLFISCVSACTGLGVQEPLTQPVNHSQKSSTGDNAEALASVSHVVFVWLSPAAPEGYVETLIDETQVLRKIPGLLSLTVGRAIPSDRKIVDDSFDLAIAMQFKDVETMRNYLSHPIHKGFVAKYVKDKVARIQVYDFE